MEKSNLAKLISNYGSRLWSMISVFIFIPLYIKYLGADNYGLIGFYALLLGLIGFADAGMSSAIIKEFSQESDSTYKYTIFRNLERIYLIICVFIFLIICFGAELIVNYWISSKKLSTQELVYYVRLIGLGVTTQLISSLYFGALFALNNQVRSNLIQLFWSFSKSALVLVLFFILSKSIEIYFIWQIICNFLYIIVLRFYIIVQLKKNSDVGVLVKQFNKLPRHITDYIGGMVFIAIISALNIQADKIVTSSMFSLETFGFYNMASSLAQLPVIFATPLVAFAFPLFSKFSSSKIENNEEKNVIVFNKLFYLVNLMTIVLIIGVFFYAKDILLLWTKSEIPYKIFDPIIFDVKILIIGSFFLALQFPLYYFLLSKGKTRYTIYQGAIQILIGIPLLYIFSKKYGLYGIPIPWLIINLMSFIYLFIIVKNKYMKLSVTIFLKRVISIPILATLFINIIIYQLYRQVSISFIPFIAVASIISLLVSIMAFNKQTNNKILSYKHLYNFPNE